jgi:hypothetical protein
LVVGGLAISTASLVLRAEDKPAGSAAKPAAPSPEQMQQMMKQMAAMQAPGEQHKMLMKQAGTYKTEARMKMDPNEPEQVSAGESKLTAILGGRFLLEETKGSMMGQPYSGLGLLGYDNVKKQFVTTWVDTMSTAPMTMYGTPDASSKSITYAGETDCPLQPGTKMKMRIVWNLDSDTAFHLDFYEDMGQGERKSMTIAYTRT